VSAQQNPYLIPVKLSTGFSVLYIVVGALLLLLALLTLLGGRFSIQIVLGPLLLLFGIMSFVKPYCVFDTATGALNLYSPLGFQVRAYGTPKNERIYFNPATSRVMRARPDGKQSKVSMFGVNREDLARLVAALPQHQA
jgi:hypothetical protein